MAKGFGGGKGGFPGGGNMNALLKQAQKMQEDMQKAQQEIAESVIEFVAREGKDAIYKSITLRKACCGIRKMEPLERALQGKSAWLTGLRREQSGARAEVARR